MNKKILLVDDTLFMRKVVSGFLDSLGLEEVVEAEDGRQALHLLTETQFALVISDWKMPKCDGLELLAKIRSMPLLGKQPFILITAESGAREVRTAHAAGVNGYLTKPFTLEALRREIQAACPTLLGVAATADEKEISAAP